MKATRNILISGLAGLCMAASASAASLGAATVTVLHPYTLGPVAGVPVTVLPKIKPGRPAPSVYWTDRDGRITAYLAEGKYEAFVSFNNIVSERVRFEIIADFHPFVTVYFNPDIDN